MQNNFLDRAVFHHHRLQYDETMASTHEQGQHQWWGNGALVEAAWACYHISWSSTSGCLHISHIYFHYHIYISKYPPITSISPIYISFIKQNIRKAWQKQGSPNTRSKLSFQKWFLHIFAWSTFEDADAGSKWEDIALSGRRRVGGEDQLPHWGGCSREKRGRNRAATKLRDQERNTREMQLIALPSFKERLALERWGEIAPRWG